MTTDKHDLLSAYIEQEMQQAEGGRYGNDGVETFRKQALDYYNAVPRGDEVDDRSQIVSQDLASAVSANEALMRSMLLDDATIRIEAESPEDEAMAKAESDICRDVIFRYNEGSRIVMASVKDSLISRQAVVAIDIEEIDGQNNFNLRSVPSENISFQAGYEGKLQDIRFFAERVQLTRSDLVEAGVPREKVANMGSSAVIDNGTQSARNADRTSWPGEAADPSMEIVDSWYAYIKADLDDDGIAERYRCLYVDDKCVQYELHDILPYAMGSPFVSPHRLSGESLHDKLKQVQDIGTSLDRQLMDNVSLINNGRYVYDPARVTEDDIMSPTAGGGIRASDPSAVIQLQVLDVTPGILAAKEQNRRRRSEVAGAAMDMASAEGQLATKNVLQVSVEKSNSELITVLIASNLAESLMRGLFILVHESLRRFATRPYVARVSGQAVPINPLLWQQARHWTAKPGKSPQEKGQEAQALGMHIQLSAQAMQSGMQGVLADPTTLYRTQMRYLALNGVSDPETYAIDPTSPAAQQAMSAMQQQQQQLQQLQAMSDKMQLDLEQAKIAEDGRQHDEEIKWKYYDTDLDAEQKAAGEAMRERTHIETAKANASARNGADQSPTSNEGAA